MIKQLFNVIFISVSIVSVLSIALKRQKENFSSQERRTQSYYNCDKRSYFRKVKLFSVESNTRPFICNAVYEGRINYTATALAVRQDRDVAIEVIEAYYALRDVNGTEVYSSLGVVAEGQCIGAVVYLYNFGKVTRDSCNSRNGLTKVENRDGSAMLAIRGVCDSTCMGTVTVHYSTGKRSRLDDNRLDYECEQCFEDKQNSEFDY